MPHKDPEQRRAWRRAYERQRYAADPAYHARMDEKHRAWVAANPGRVKEIDRRAGRKWRERNPEHNREYHATLAHGISRLVRDWMYESQGRACAGCKTPMPDAELEIDHDHGCCTTARSCGRCVRGLVCLSCNARDVMTGIFAARFEGVA